jgi:hypothetical protein
MHRALLLDDIVSLVTSCVENCDGLYALATVNRSFSFFALERMWTAPIVWNLAKCMDASLWHIEIDESMLRCTLVSHVDVFDMF